MKSERMYRERIKNIGAFVGCRFNCSYCAFRGILGRFNTCLQCKAFEPHAHLDRLNNAPPETKEGEFLTIGLNGDVSFAPGEVIERTAEYCSSFGDREFLIQSKNPAVFLMHRFPSNVILGTTMETDDSWIPSTRVRYGEISRAPTPYRRYLAMLALKRFKNKRLVTIEPVLDFNLDTLTRWIKEIRPNVVYVGYDSHPKRNKLPEPPLEKTLELVEELRSELGKRSEVRTKLLRPAWWEKTRSSLLPRSPITKNQ